MSLLHYYRAPGLDDAARKALAAQVDKTRASLETLRSLIEVPEGSAAPADEDKAGDDKGGEGG